MKKVLAILLTAVMLLSLTVTAYAEGDTGNSKITAKLADMISSAEADSKLPVAVTADLSLPDEVSDSLTQSAAEQAGVEYEDYSEFVNDPISYPGGISQEDKEQLDMFRAKMRNFENIRYSLLKEARLEKINAVLEASGADIEDMDGGFYTTACLMLPKRIMLTPAKISALADLDIVTSLDVGKNDPAPAEKDLSKIITKELAARLDEIGDDERVSVYLSYGVYDSPHRIVGNNDDSYEPTDQIIRELYGYRTTNVNRVTEFELWSKRNRARKLYNSDYYSNYRDPLRLKTLNLGEDDTYVYSEDGTANIELLKLTRSKLYEIIRNDNIIRADLVDPYGNPPVPDEPSAGWFIVGTMTDWQLDSGYKIADSNKGGTVGFTLFMTPDDSFKIVYSPDGKTLDNAVYYPAGRGNAFNQENPIILRNGYYWFSFRPACDGGITYFVHKYSQDPPEVWYYNCIYCRGYDPWAGSGDVNRPNPDPDHNDPEPGYYIVGTMTDWQLNKNYKFNDALTKTGFTSAYFQTTLPLRMCDKFKIAYSEDGVNITRWYPEGEGNAYNEDVRRIFGDSPWCNVVFMPYGNGAEHGAHYGMILVEYLELPDSNEPLSIPAEGELFKAKLKADYSLSDADFSDYEELCYHKDKDGLPDWTLVKVKTADASEQTYSGIIANRVCEHEQSASLFGSGYGIYDAAEKRFIPLTDDIVGRYKDLGRIFDNLGSGRLIGDVDSDDELTAIDCTLIQRCSTRICDWPEDDIVDSEGLDLVYFSDFDRDGERDIVDATRLQRYVTYID